jgi:hypothetical protein
MAKRTLFILIGIGILALSAIIFLLIGKLGKSNNEIQSANQSSTPSPATLPTEVANSQQNAQDVQKIIENAKQDPISAQTTQDGSKLVDFKDQSGNPISLSDFEKTTGSTINQQLRSYLDSKDYRIFYCPAENNGKDFGVYLGYNVSRAYDNLYPDTKKWMKDWEKNMLRDLHMLLFPDIVFSDNDLNQQLQFKDGKYRYAEIRLPGGKISSINYHVSDNGVIISTALPCLSKIVDIYEPLEP